MQEKMGQYLSMKEEELEKEEEYEKEELEKVEEEEKEIEEELLENIIEEEIDEEIYLDFIIHLLSKYKRLLNKSKDPVHLIDERLY